MSEDIKQLLEKFNISLEDPTPFLGDGGKYYYTYVVVPNNEESSMYLKVYFGQHITRKLNDGYIASGVKIKKYLKKNPGQFYRKILGFYSNIDELNHAEKALIDGHLNKDYCLNLKEGGIRALMSEETKKKCGECMRGKHHSDVTKKRISESSKGRNFQDSMTPESIEEWRKKLSVAKKGKYAGENSWMYGRTGALSPKSKKIEIDGVPYCSKREAAAALGKSRETIRNWVKQGKARYI